MERDYWSGLGHRRIGRRGLLRSAGVVTAGGVAAALIGCGKKSAGTGGTAGQTQPGAATAAAGPPRRGGHLGRFLSSSTNFNIVANWYEGTTLSGVTVYDRLLTSRTDKRRYVLEAAASVEQPDPLTVTFKLKPNLVYQNLPPVNGRAVSPDDIIATQDYGRSLAKAYDNAFQKDFLDHVESPDAQTVIYKLKAPDAYLFSDTQLGNPTAQAIIPKELLDNLDTNKPVGSGPWYLADYQMNTRYLYKRFDQFRDAAKGLPYIDEQEVIASTDPVAQEAALRSEQVHLWFQPPPSTIDRILSEAGAKISLDKAVGLSVYAFHLNVQRPPWNDMRVREALYRLTDKQQYVNLVFSGRATVPPGPIPAGLTDYQLDPKETAPYFKNDVAEAKKLLQAAGYDFNKEYEIICSATQAVNGQGAQVWQQQLARAGVKVRVSVLPFAEWLPQRIAPGNFDIILGGSPGDDTPARSIRLHASDQKNQFSHTGLHDPEVDALIEKSERETNPDENIKLVKQIELMVLQKYSPTYMIVTQEWDNLRNARLHDYEVNPAYPQAPMYQTQMWFSA